MQMQAMRCHCIPVRIAKNPKHWHHQTLKEYGATETRLLLVGMQNASHVGSYCMILCFCLYKMSKIGKSIKTENRFMFSCGWWWLERNMGGGQLKEYGALWEVMKNVQKLWALHNWIYWKPLNYVS